MVLLVTLPAELRMCAGLVLKGQLRSKLQPDGTELHCATLESHHQQLMSSGSPAHCHWQAPSLLPTMATAPAGS